MEGKVIDESKLKNKGISDKDKTEIIALAILSIIWSVGAVIDDNGRKDLEIILRDIVALIPTLEWGKGVGSEL